MRIYRGGEEKMNNHQADYHEIKIATTSGYMSLVIDEAICISGFDILKRYRLVSQATTNFTKRDDLIDSLNNNMHE